MDQIDSRSVGHWASAYQMEAVVALTHRLGTSAPRAYGRFFAYRVAALTNFRWQAGLIADDIQLADFVREHSVPARTVEQAQVLVTPAASSEDFHLQTQKFIAARTLMPSGGRAPALDRVAAAAITAARHPLWAVAYATARAASGARQRTIADLLRRLVGTSGHDEADDRRGLGKKLWPRPFPRSGAKEVLLGFSGPAGLSQLA